MTTSPAHDPVALSKSQLKRVHLRRDRPAAALRPIVATSPLPGVMATEVLTACYEHGANAVMDTWLSQGPQVALAGLDTALTLTAGYRFDRTTLPLARRLREHIATADDELYATLVAEVADWRTTRLRSVVAAYLVPTESSFATDLNTANNVDELRWLLMAVSDAKQLSHITMLARNRRLDPFTVDTPATLADACGVDFLPYLYAWISTYLNSAPVSKQLLSLAYDQQSPDAFAAIAAPFVAGSGAYAAREAIFKRGFAKSPALAAQAFLPAMATDGSFATKHRSLAEHFIVDHPDLIDAELPRYDERTQAFVAVIRDERAGATMTVSTSPGDVPALLADPPWQNRANKTKRITVADIEPLLIEPTMHWQPGERDAWRHSSSHQPELADPADWDTLTGTEQAQLFRFGDVETMRPMARTFTNMNQYHRDYAARFELDWSGAVREFVHRRKQGWETPAWAIVQPFGLPDLVEPIVEVYGKGTGAAGFATAWLIRHGELAAAHLVPRVVSPSRKGRSVADGALRMLARHDEAIVRSTAERYGDDVVAAIDQFLAVNPLDVLPTRVPALPDYVRASELKAPVLVATGEALPPSATANIVIMLALSKETQYAGVEHVRELCEPDSLAAFALSLYRVWAQAGPVRKDAWLASGIDLFGNDSIIADIAGIISKDVKVSDDERRNQIDLLGRLASDAALGSLFHISNVIPRKVTARDARKKVEEMADLRGLTRDELADRLIRNFDLDDRASLTLDFGPRAFTVTFDETLTPVIVTEDGEVRKALPKATKTDDVDLAANSHAVFKRLKRDVKKTATEQVKRFEKAMNLGRRWTRSDWQQHFVEHPLMIHLVSRLVWGVYTSADLAGNLETSFRIAEDGSYADASDNTLVLPDDAIVGVAHPVELTECAAWSEIFSDYEIGQPFEQVQRGAFRAGAPPAGIDTTHGLGLDGNPVVPYRRIFGLTSRGWDNEQIGSSTSNFSRELRQGRVSLGLDPGFAWGQAYEDQKLLPIAYDLAGDVVDVSELLRDLVWLSRPS